MPTPDIAGCDVLDALRRAADAAEEGARRTAALAAGAGRASYVPGAQYRGLPDPGALGVAVWLMAAAEAKYWIVSDSAVLLSRELLDYTAPHEETQQ